MNKFLLLGASALVAASAMATSPRMYDNAYCLSISNDGKMTASEISGRVVIYNNETGTETVFDGDEMLPYSIGQGNAFSNNYTIVCNYGNLPGYISGAQWNALPTPYTENINLAQGITSDGTRICGSVGAQSISLEDTDIPMQVPVIWNLNEDGTWSDPVMLPYPAKDYTNRIPQYVTAIAISDDGKTVVGQMMDYSGSMPTLIYYTLNDKNEWQYNNTFQKLANPNNVEIPAYPGEGPAQPSILDFMTSTEVAAYEKAVEDWQNEGSWDYSTYPVAEDFATEEEKTKWEAAKSEWQTQFNTWSDKYNNFLDAIDACNSIGLQFNCVNMTSDGKTVLCTAETYESIPDSWYATTLYSPITFNLADGTYTLFERDGGSATSISDDGTVMCYRYGDTQPRQGFVYLPGTTENPLSLFDYYKDRDQETYEWMNNNMVHDTEGVDPDTYEPITLVGYEFTGVPLIAKNGSAVVCAVENAWDYSDEASYYYSYYLPDNSVVGIDDTTLPKDNVRIKAFRGGRILVEGDARALAVYAVDGSEVFAAATNGGSIETGLTNGVYIVSVTTSNGKFTKKVVF